MFVTKEKCDDKSFQIASIYLCKYATIFQFHTLYFFDDDIYICDQNEKVKKIKLQRIFL